MQAKVGPALHKLDQALKSVQSEAVIPIVGQVSHEDADLRIGKTWDTGKSASTTTFSSWPQQETVHISDCPGCLG